jgi:hypothetical protein
LVLSAIATRYFSTELAESGLSLQQHTGHHLMVEADDVDGSCSTGIERAKVQLSSTARKGATQ